MNFVQIGTFHTFLGKCTFGQNNYASHTLAISYIALTMGRFLCMCAFVQIYYMVKNGEVAYQPNNFAIDFSV